MLLWRLSGTQHATALDGGYGRHFDGRWNTIGHAVTYCATSPALCVLEKLVHIEDPTLLPELVMITYELPDDASLTEIDLSELPSDWRLSEVESQKRGDSWHETGASLLLRVPSAIVPVSNSPDLNVLVNHRHAAAGDIRIADLQPFTLDQRLF